MKKCYIITFELKNPGINQQNLVDTIKSAKNWARLSPTSFILTANKTATEVRDILLKQLKQGDKVYVGLLGNSAGWFGLGEEISTWIRNNQK